MIASALLLRGYAMGVFPMAMENGEIGWFSPDPRGIIPLDGFHVPHGLRRTLARNLFEVRIDTSFMRVMQACAQREDTWISDEIIASYVALHDLGCAHSVEVWLGNELAGGLYGVALGGAFFGESMFHTVTDASKVALWALVQRLLAQKFTLLDIQWLTPHLQQFGAVQIPRADYLHRLGRAVQVARKFADE